MTERDEETSESGAPSLAGDVEGLPQVFCREDVPRRERFPVLHDHTSDLVDVEVDPVFVTGEFRVARLVPRQSRPVRHLERLPFCDHERIREHNVRELRAVRRIDLQGPGVDESVHHVHDQIGREEALPVHPLHHPTPVRGVDRVRERVHPHRVVRREEVELQQVLGGGREVAVDRMLGHDQLDGLDRGLGDGDRLGRRLGRGRRGLGRSRGR